VPDLRGPLKCAVDGPINPREAWRIDPRPDRFTDEAGTAHMDMALLGGLVMALLSIIVSTVMDGNSFGPLIGPSSFVLVFFGAVGCGMTGVDKSDLGRLPKAAIRALKGATFENSATVTTMAQLADVARREGVLALESRLADIGDDFLRKGAQLILDGVDSDRVEETLMIQMDALESRHRLVISFFEAVGGYLPTFGMIGTVIGLINMLGNLADPDQLGAGMAVALLTTLYGVIFANMLFLPIAGKLKFLMESELASMRVVLDGILSIQAGMSPQMLVERLECYLPKAEQRGYADRMADLPAKAA
jgi:chemotaxis protein MotA